MFVKFSPDILTKIVLGNEINLVVKLILSIEEKNKEFTEKPRIVEVQDEITFKLVPSPIILILSGHNTVYGKNSLIIIDGSDTFDPDIEGMHYYLPFTFQWICPIEVPTYEWSNNPSFSNRPYSLSLYAQSLINYGLHYNTYYKFEVVAKRQEKVARKTFWIKILNSEDVPKLGNSIATDF